MLHLNQRIDTILTELKDFGCVGLKAEFEAEGTRDDELIWLAASSHKNNLPLTIKIGGCEAIRDLNTVKSFGAKKIVAPMIESVYALKKFSHSLNKVYPQKITNNLFNIETVTGFDNCKDIIDYASADSNIDGVVFGRVDFSGSLNLTRDSINTDKITSYVNQVGKYTNKHNLELIVGGSVDNNAYTQLKNMKYITGFETRKVVFKSDMLNHVTQQDFNHVIDLCAEFELLWLETKYDHYTYITNEDITRIDMLRKRVDG